MGQFGWLWLPGLAGQMPFAGLGRRLYLFVPPPWVARVCQMQAACWAGKSWQARHWGRQNLRADLQARGVYKGSGFWFQI